MTPIEDYFEAIFCLTLRRRADRRAKIREVFDGLGFDPSSIGWVFGPDRPLDHSGKPNGNQGCVAGHRMILDHMISCHISRALIFEDDVEVAFDSPEMQKLVDPQDLFQRHINEVPKSWDMLFLGGGYADNPQRRISPHVIRFNRMMTTSSYGITLKMAKIMAPSISGIGPIDSLYGGFQPYAECYIFQPRLFTQGNSYSDLTDREDDHRPSMLDTRHEEMLIAGAWRDALDGRRLYDSEINRREIAGPNDLDGQQVIVDGKTFIIEAVKLPKHPAPWRRGEHITYQLRAE